MVGNWKVWISASCAFVLLAAGCGSTGREVEPTAARSDRIAAGGSAVFDGRIPAEAIYVADGESLEYKMAGDELEEGRPCKPSRRRAPRQLATAARSSTSCACFALSRFRCLAQNFPAAVRCDPGHDQA